MIFVCGDVHGEHDIDKLYNWEKQKELTRNDYLIILGDIGLLWKHYEDELEKKLKEFYNSLNPTVLFIDGNHENFDRLFSNEFNIIDKFNGKVKQISDNIFYLQRGYVYTIDDKKVFTFGGGYSIDKIHRILNVSWWPQELPNYEEYSRGLKSLEDVGNDVDFILTHTCPSSIFIKLLRLYKMSHKISEEEYPFRKYLEEIKETVKFKSWHFGHFHEDNEIIENFYVHYMNEPMRIA